MPDFYSWKQAALCSFCGGFKKKTYSDQSKPYHQTICSWGVIITLNKSISLVLLKVNMKKKQLYENKQLVVCLENLSLPQSISCLTEASSKSATELRNEILISEGPCSNWENTSKTRVSKMFVGCWILMPMLCYHCIDHLHNAVDAFMLAALKIDDALLVI